MPNRSIWWVLALWLWAGWIGMADAASHQPLQPGTFIRIGETGTLMLRRAGTGALEFELESFGANGNICTAKGRVSGRVATAVADDEEQAQDPCRLELQPRGDRLRVNVLTGACAAHCGLRVTLDGDFRSPAAGCKRAAIAQRRGQFLKQYRAQQHAEAVRTAQALLTECEDFLFWITQDAIRSDLALAQLRAGHPQACLSTLAQTAAGKVDDEAGLRRALSPNAYESYEWAHAIWHNRRLCQQAIGGGVGSQAPVKERPEPDVAPQ
ncbi:hypothetical protein [Inhella proteolytica]|uniref:Uncharacterized protein n=1 Tax=Inhella proteolytica TaxID=2795029 RepID=A0A931J0H6_9BURK|nr:hypothetical protein [Inhella proteolytica]MBH9577221.1 hypothetical protein [Inhella proteolytica]